MKLQDFLWSAYREIKRADRVFLLQCTNASCDRKKAGKLLHRLSTDGVKGQSCPKCHYTLATFELDKGMSESQIRTSLVEPSLVSTKELTALTTQFTLEDISPAVIAKYNVAAARELRHRQSISTNGSSAKAKYHEYIKPPGEKDIWLSRAVLTALRIEGSSSGEPQPATGSFGVCTLADGSAKIGFSGDRSKSLKYSAMLESFLPLYKSLYPNLKLSHAMAENTELIDKYYGAFKTIKGGTAVKSTWERHCAESKFLDLTTIRTQHMASCTVIWIGNNSMNSDFSLLQGGDRLGSPMLPCGGCQELSKFLDEL